MGSKLTDWVPRLPDSRHPGSRKSGSPWSASSARHNFIVRYSIADSMYNSVLTALITVLLMLDILAVALEVTPFVLFGC